MLKSPETVWHPHTVGKTERSALKGQRPCILWFTGLSGSGKSTLANALERRLIEEGRHTFLLDGDNLRHGLNRDLGFSDTDRRENIRRVGEVAKLFVESGLMVLVALISPFEAQRRQVREMVEPGEFIEIFVDTPLEVCRARDPKGLYAKAQRGEIIGLTGIDAPYEVPTDPEIHLRDFRKSPEETVETILAYLRTNGYFDAF